MSREFGEFVGGYFAAKAVSLASDAESGSFEITRLWGQLLAAFLPVADAIALAEASDASEAKAILVSIEQSKSIWKALYEIQMYLETFEDVIRIAVEKAAKGEQP